MTLTDRFDHLTPAMLARMPLLTRAAFDFAFLVAKWQMRSATRRGLAKLDRHLLCDIGVDQDVAHQEVTKRFWQD